MKKVLLGIVSTALIILTIYLVTGYHTTPQGKFDELLKMRMNSC